LKISNDDDLYIAYFFVHITAVDLKNVFMNTAFYTENSILTQIYCTAALQYIIGVCVPF